MDRSVLVTSSAKLVSGEEGGSSPHEQQCADDGDGIFNKSNRQIVSPNRLYQARPELVAAELANVRREETQFSRIRNYEISFVDQHLKWQESMSARAPVRLSDAQRFAPRISKKVLHFLETVPDAIILSDQKGRIVLVNANTEQMFGYSRGELVGKEVESLVPERFRALHREDRAAYYANPIGRRMGAGRDLCACNKDGVEFPVEISIAPVEIRGKTMVWSAIRDIGDRERSIARIPEAMQKNRFVLGGLISVCAWCKRVRDEGVWLPLETYVASHSEVKFTHGICKDCLGTLSVAGHKHEAANHKPHRRRDPQEGDSSMPKTSQNRLYMVVEHFKDAAQVYQRLWDRGRILPKGLVLVSAWFDENVERSYRLMQTHDRRRLDKWMANWDDLIDFEVYPVITPEEAGEKVAARMRSSASHRSAGHV